MRGKAAQALGSLLALGALAALAAFAQAEVAQRGDLRVSVSATMRPTALPRTGAAPISVLVGGHVTTTDGSHPPQLATLKIEINRHGHFDYEGLPSCAIRQIQPASTRAAYRACRDALVGQGTYQGTIALPGGSPYAIEGRLLLFNARSHGRPVIFAHVYSGRPFAVSFVMTFEIEQESHGVYGTVLVANLRQALGARRNLTGIEMTLSRHWRSGGHSHSYLSAGCPAPAGFRSAPFPLLRASFAFAGGLSLENTLTRRCEVRE